MLRTSKDKILGGYTPLPCNISEGFQEDISNQTFIFSLSLKEAYDCLQSGKSIFSSKACGPNFGWDDICIIEHAHEKPTPIRFPTTFNRMKNSYPKSEETSEKFCGMKSGEVTLM